MKQKLLYIILSLVLVTGHITAQTLSGTKTVCTSGCNYTSLTKSGGAFQAINNATVTGDLTLVISGNITEDASNYLNTVTYSGGAHTITIQPDGSTTRVISGTIASFSMIEFVGVAHVTINGNYNGSGRYLLFRNTGAGTSTTPVMEFGYSSSGILVSNCIIESGAAGGSGTAITIGASGNNTVSITGNTIGNASSASPNSGIYSNNSGNVITVSSNTIYNWKSNGLYFLNVGNGCTISDNSFYNSQSNTNPQTAIHIGAGSGHTISGNYIGGSSANCGGTAWANSGAQIFRGIFLDVGTGSATSVQENIIQNIALSGGGASNFYGMYINSGDVSIGTTSGNTIGHTSTANSITYAGTLVAAGIYNLSTGTVTIQGNTLANITATGTGSNVVLNGIRCSGGTLSIAGNTIYTLKSSSSSGLGLFGIYASTGQANPSITGNLIHDLYSANTTSGQWVGGIGGSGTINGTLSITRNRIYDIRTISTSSNATAAGIYLIASAGTASVANNQVSIMNSGGSDPAIHGIYLGSTAAVNLYYNTVYIGGTATGGSQITAAFTRDANTTIAMRNNIFYNERTGGSGYHVAISRSSPGWTSSMSNYNLLVSAASSSVGYDGITRTFSAWKSTTSGDANSISHTSSDLSAAGLFTDVSNGNLSINADNTEAWVVNGRGWQLSGITEDYGSASAGRSTTVADGAPDLGADEFVPTGTPPVPETSGTIGAGNTQTFSLAENSLGSIDWDPGSTDLPSAITWSYYSGVKPPGFPGTCANGYWRIEVTGGSSYTYDITLHYDPAMLGIIGSEADIIVKKKPVGGSTWTNYTSGITLDTANDLVTLSGLTSFSDFTLGDGVVPLPVELINLSAHLKEKNQVTLDWTTGSEMNNDRFEVERSADGMHFHPIGTVMGHGNSQVVQSYSFVDKRPLTGVNYYRLKQVDYNGEFEYSKTVLVKLTRSLEFTMYPNPANGTIVSIALDEKADTDTELRLIDAQGRVVKSQVFSPESSEIKLNIAGLSNGVYLLQLLSPQSTHTEKLVIKN